MELDKFLYFGCNVIDVLTKGVSKGVITVTVIIMLKDLTELFVYES